MAKPSPWGSEKSDASSSHGAMKASIIDGEYGQCGMIVLWADGHVSVLMGTDSPVKSEAEKGSSYTTSRPEGEKVYHMARAHYSGMGFALTDVAT